MNRIRVLAAIGPGDVVRAHTDWVSGIRTPSETSITFSSQLFECLKKHEIPYWAISSHPNAALRVANTCRIENRPRPGPLDSSGLKFHWYQILYGMSLFRSARSFNATHAIIDSGTAHWFVFFLFAIVGIEVIPNFHNVYWPVGNPPTGFVKRVLFWLNSLFFRFAVKVALGVSPECGRQISVLSDGKTCFFEYRAQFVAADFAGIGRPIHGIPFRVVFAGRIERNKGVFDILDLMGCIESIEPGLVEFDICGSGPAWDRLARLVEQRGFSKRVRLHGKLERPELLKVYSTSQLFIVPTRSDFCEGLPMVCAEAVLSGRPVLTSSLSNALEVLDGAVIEARQDLPSDYAEKLLLIIRDKQRYDALVAATSHVAATFCDADFGLAAAVERCLFFD